MVTSPPLGAKAARGQGRVETLPPAHRSLATADMTIGRKTMVLKDRRAYDRLRTMTVFSACSDAELKQVLRHVSEWRFPAGETLAHQGRRGREFLVVVEGTARVEIDGREIAILGPGDFFGEMALLDGGPRSASVIAVTDLVADIMNRIEFEHILTVAPHVAKAVLTGLARRLREVDLHLAAEPAGTRAIKA
jgi:CRP-like cAMP-binding protein